MNKTDKPTRPEEVDELFDVPPAMLPKHMEQICKYIETLEAENARLLKSANDWAGAQISDAKITTVPGDSVEKNSGDYRGPGNVELAFELPDGRVRYVVSHRIEGGVGTFLHIYSGKQLTSAEYKPVPTVAIREGK